MPVRQRLARLCISTLLASLLAKRACGIHCNRHESKTIGSLFRRQLSARMHAYADLTFALRSASEHARDGPVLTPDVLNQICQRS